jgi:hypothetical protein
MSKSNWLAILAVLFVAGLVLIGLDRWQIGTALSSAAILILLVVAMFEPSAELKPIAPKPEAVPALALPKPPASPAPKLVPPAAQPPAPAVKTPEQPPADTSALEALRKEVLELTALVDVKTREVEQLVAKLKDRRDIRMLQRIAQLQHALDFNRLMLSKGKMDAARGLQELEIELESALGALGIVVHAIEVGAKVRELADGSFELVGADAAPSPELGGTVKAVRQVALAYTDNEGNRHFLIPAKIEAYKLS